MSKNFSQRLFAHKWLQHGIIALAIAGLYSVILVILRTPQLSHFFQNKEIFKSALVIHVNLSVLVWLLSITCTVWSLSRFHSIFDTYFMYISSFGMLLMAISPLWDASHPVMNNYIPMLENIIFVIGLSCFGASLLCFAIYSIFTSFCNVNWAHDGERIIFITKFTSSIMFVLVWICFYLSYKELDQLRDIVQLEVDFYYELLYWSGGHLLQFIYTQIFMIILLILAETWRGGKLSFIALYEMIFALNFVLSLLIFVGHYQYEISDGAFKEFFTYHMIYCAGVAPVIFIALLTIDLILAGKNIIIKRNHMLTFVPVAFLSGILLFLSGGAIGSIISGINVTIPAHYHGSIVGISIAFMGFAYIFCFQNDIYKMMHHTNGVTSSLTLHKNSLSSPDAVTTNLQKLASRQLYIITIGQILHITGLALAGGYGVLRKNPGEDIPLSAKLYMGMVGGGGLIAIIGGLIFIYICVRTLYSIRK